MKWLLFVFWGLQHTLIFRDQPYSCVLWVNITGQHQ